LSLLVVMAAACSVKVREVGFQREAEQSLLDEYEQSLAGRWSPSSEIEHVSLGGNETHTLDVSLAAGQIAAVLGSCDEDCLDLNIEVLGPDGFQVARDEGSAGGAKYPFAQFSSQDSATYKVVIGMADCSAEPCSVAFWVMRDRSGSEAASDLFRFYGEELASEWAREAPVIQSSNLAAGRAYAVDRDFAVGQTIGVVAACDANCVDLNIEVRGPDGFQVARDEDTLERARYPFAQFAPRVTGTYRIEFGMAECNEEPCSFAYWVVRKRASG
jgi:hypothetical protein